ncbi:uncharacterized protein LOC129595261 [Paramacrobiotus metropolitanus]|uniref:uncharacterized protein LOC129595261 n=1 Tax=Paramacrobiotus metropolitanus TaxID=2943436 RepID=UPI002445A9A8|nr:uncharacterized protein LOC129595261 [Paramacrobiotus metropolitanus]
MFTSDTVGKTSNSSNNVSPSKRSFSSHKPAFGDIGPLGNQTSPLTAAAVPKKPNHNAHNQSLSTTTAAESISAVSTPPKTSKTLTANHRDRQIRLRKTTAQIRLRR